MCNYRLPDKKKCKNIDYITNLKVNVIHSNSGRKTWQTWKICKKHFLLFMSVEGKGWEVYYKNKASAFVMGYKIE